MIRVFVLASCAVALFGGSAPATADPAEQGDSVFAIGKCYDPSQPPLQRPGSFAYNCDTTGVMQDMTWSFVGSRRRARNWHGQRGRVPAQLCGGHPAVQSRSSCTHGTRSAPTSPACPAGVRFYSDMTIAYPGGAPPWIKPGTSWSPGTDFVTVDGMPAVHYSGLTPTCAPL